MISFTVVMERDIIAHRILHTDQNDVWVYGACNTLTLYDEQLVEKKKTLSLTFNLYDMALTVFQDILAIVNNNKCVVKISPSGDVSTFCSTAPLAPRGICINNRGNIVIGLNTASTMTTFFYTHKLAVYSPDGSTVLQEIENDEDGTPLFREGISQVKQNGNGDYVVNNCDRIVCVSSEGRFRWDYLLGTANVNVIFGMVYDKYDNVIIADILKILLLSSEGKLVTTLLTREDGIRWPRSLSIDRHGQLWIGQALSFKVVKYLK